MLIRPSKVVFSASFLQKINVKMSAISFDKGLRKIMNCNIHTLKCFLQVGLLLLAIGESAD